MGQVFYMSSAVRILFTFLLLLGQALAQNSPSAGASFSAPEAQVQRPLQYTVIIYSDQRVVDLPNLRPPAGLEFQSAGTEQRIEARAGEIVTKNTLVYRVIPKREGEFTVPGFDMVVDGQVLRVPEARLTVKPPEPGQEYQPLRAVLELPNREVYVGETVGGRLVFIGTRDETPAFVQHISKTTGTVLFKASRMGRPFSTVVEGEAFPSLAMPVEITPMVEGENPITCEAVVQVQKRDAGFRTRIGEQSTVISQPVVLKVKALPKAGRPEGFTGAIGEFTVSPPKLSAKESQAGEPVTLSFSLTGEGNLESVPAPEVAETPNWTIYKPSSDISRDDDVGKLSKTFTYTLVPRKEGRTGTPPLPFAYFDPVKGAFVDITVPPMPFVVTAAPAPTVPDPGSAAAGSTAVEMPPVEPEPVLTGLAEKSGPWMAHLAPSFSTFFYAQFVPPAMLLALWGWRRRKEYLAAHPEIPLRKRARAAAQRALGEARSAARRGDTPAFLRAGATALCEAAARIDTARSESLTPAEVLGELQGDSAQSARTIFLHAEASHYASGAAEPPKPRALLPGLEEAVHQLLARA